MRRFRRARCPCSRPSSFRRLPPRAGSLQTRAALQRRSARRRHAPGATNRRCCRCTCKGEPPRRWLLVIGWWWWCEVVVVGSGSLRFCFVLCVLGQDEAHPKCLMRGCFLPMRVCVCVFVCVCLPGRVIADQHCTPTRTNCGATVYAFAATVGWKDVCVHSPLCAVHQAKHGQGRQQL